MAKHQFGNTLKSKRVELGLTQQEAANKMQVDVATIRRMEQGYTSNMETFEKYCEFLGMTLCIYDRDKSHTYIPQTQTYVSK